MKSLKSVQNQQVIIRQDIWNNATFKLNLMEKIYFILGQTCWFWSSLKFS
jgi:hypothetical protein